MIHIYISFLKFFLDNWAFVIRQSYSYVSLVCFWKDRSHCVYRNFRCISRGLCTDFTYETPGCGLYTGAAYTLISFPKIGRFGKYLVSQSYKVLVLIIIFYLLIVYFDFFFYLLFYHYLKTTGRQYE